MLKKELSSDFSNCVFSTLDVQNSTTLKTNTTPSVVFMDVQPFDNIQNSDSQCGCVTNNICCESINLRSTHPTSKHISSTSSSTWNTMEKDKTQLMHNVSYIQKQGEVVVDVKPQALQLSSQKVSEISV